MTVNLSFIEGNVTMTDVMVGINDNVNNSFGAGILIALMLVVFISTKSQGTGAALIASGFVGSIIGALISVLGIMDAGLLFVPIAVLFGGIVALIADKP